MSNWQLYFGLVVMIAFHVAVFHAFRGNAELSLSWVGIAYVALKLEQDLDSSRKKDKNKDGLL